MGVLFVILGLWLILGATVALITVLAKRPRRGQGLTIHHLSGPGSQGREEPPGGRSR